MRGDLQKAVLNSPAACCVLVSRARLSSEKHNRPLDQILPEYLRQGIKLHDALDSTEGLSLRRVNELIQDERDDFYSARLRESDQRQAKMVALNGFIREVTAIAETVIPGIYFDGVANELA